MRLPEEKVKQAILDRDAEVRERAVRYFSASFSEDATLVPLVIEAVERYGREGAYHLVGACTRLIHTDESISWVVDELDREDADQYENYAFNLTRVLCHADPALLIHRDSQILEARHFLAGLRDEFLQRLEMLSWDETTCWSELENVCEDGKDKQYVNDVDMGYASRILEALARTGDPQCEERIRSVLSQEIVDFENNPMVWMEPLMVELPGLLHLKEMVPLIIHKLHEDADFLNGRCVEALVRIGGDDAVSAISEHFPAADERFKNYATAIIEDIHSDFAAETCVRLLAQEEHKFVKRELAHAALSQFAFEAVEPARQVVLSQRLDGELRHLRNQLVLTCKIMGKRFPEYERWQADEEEEREEHERQLQEVSDDPNRMLLWALQKAKDYVARDEDEEEETAEKPRQVRIRPRGPLDADVDLVDSDSLSGRVGRNNPCPCGSGKKYKKCCMKKKRSENPLH